MDSKERKIIATQLVTMMLPNGSMGQASPSKKDGYPYPTILHGKDNDLAVGLGVMHFLSQTKYW